MQKRMVPAAPSLGTRDKFGAGAAQLRFIQPVRVACWRATGPYAQSADEAWKFAFEWLDRTCRHMAEGLGFGLAHDNPHNVPAVQLRYDACIRLPQNWDAGDSVTTSTMQLPGGPHLVNRHIGAYSALGAAIARARDIDTARAGLVIAADRPVMVLFHDDPRRTPAGEQRADVCVPVIAGPGPASSD